MLWVFSVQRRESEAPSSIVNWPQFPRIRLSVARDNSENERRKAKSEQRFLALNFALPVESSAVRADTLSDLSPKKSMSGNLSCQA